MTFLAQYFILCCENSLNSAHQSAALAGKIAEYFFFEIGFEQVTATNCNTESNNTLFGFAGGILENGIAAVEAATLQKHPAQGSTRSFRSYEEYVHIFGR